MKIGGGGCNPLSGKARSFGAGCGLSGTARMVCRSTDKLATSTAAWCFLSHRKGIKQRKI